MPEEGHLEPTREVLQGFWKKAVAMLEERPREEKVAFARADSFVGLQEQIAASRFTPIRGMWTRGRVMLQARVGGTQVEAFFAVGVWSPNTRNALACIRDADVEREEAESVLCILPAELFAINLLLLLMHKVGRDQLGDTKRFVARGANFSACLAVNHRRIWSVPIHTALSMLVRSELRERRGS